jgi:uncharacterized OB-fold protein
VKCLRCGAERIKGERYCKLCRGALLSEMKSAGYLTTVTTRNERTSEKRENTYQTKHGTGY